MKSSTLFAAAVFAAAAALLRPPAADFPAVLSRLRRARQKGATAAQRASEPGIRDAVHTVHKTWRDSRWAGVGALLASRASVRQHHWEDSATGRPLWAADLGVALVQSAGAEGTSSDPHYTHTS